MVEIVAEISGNHGGDRQTAALLISEAAQAGCDYVKFQYYRVEDMPDRHEGDNEEMYRKLAVPPEWLPYLFSVAKHCCIGLFASVFSIEGARELLSYDIPYLKIASPDSTPVDSKVIRDIVLSVVPADVEVIQSHRNLLEPRVKSLYCPLGHPPIISYDDLRIFRERNYFGFSDHTPGIRAPLAFIRAGAKMIEKHFKLQGDYECVDSAFSADPQTMALLCKLAKGR